MSRQRPTESEQDRIYANKLVTPASKENQTTLLKPSDTLTKVATVDTITNVVHIDDNSGSITVDGVFYQATQPVSIASTIATSEASPTTVYNGKTTVATAGIRAILGASTTIKSVTIKALRNNTNILYVGNSTVSNLNGLQLSAGESVSLDIDNLNKIYIDVDTSGEGCTWLAIN